MLHKQGRVLVTGASGFIGQHLCQYLHKLGYSVRATYRGLKNSCEYENVEWQNIGDIGPDTEWGTSLQNIDYVIHLAALAHQIGEKECGRKSDFFKVNTYGTKNLINQIKNIKSIKRVIYISSVSVYDQKESGRIDETTLCNPTTDYGKSKYEAENMLQEILKNKEIDWCILRPALVYGSGNPGNMKRLHQLVNLGLPLPFANIKNNRSFVFVGNLVDSIVECMINQKASRQIFLVSDGEDMSTSELIKKIGLVSGKNVIMYSVPMKLLKFIGRIGDVVEKKIKVSCGVDTYSVDRLVSSFSVNSSLICNALSWKPPFSVDKGLAMTFMPDKGLKFKL